MFRDHIVADFRLIIISDVECSGVNFLSNLFTLMMSEVASDKRILTPTDMTR